MLPPGQLPVGRTNFMLSNPTKKKKKKTNNVREIQDVSMLDCHKSGVIGY
jgi:hypothetical protein